MVNNTRKITLLKSSPNTWGRTDSTHKFQKLFFPLRLNRIHTTTEVTALPPPPSFDLLESKIVHGTLFLL
jgi:hypothetical protein